MEYLGRRLLCTFSDTLVDIFFFNCFVRFKDNNIIDKDVYHYGKTLEISNVSGLMGRYRCRVVNDYGSEFSDIADLKVFGECVGNLKLA